MATDAGVGQPPLAPLKNILQDYVNGKMSEGLALFLIDKHIELAKAQRGVTRIDQIAALVLPAVITLVDRDMEFKTREEFEDYCWQRAYSMAMAGERHHG